jgi:cell division septum initiation protein DivIVA
MPQLNIYQRLSANVLKDIMQLASEREKLSQKVQEMQEKIKSIDERITALYSDTYTDPQTYMYVPNTFAHDVMTKSKASLRKMATTAKSARGGRR